MYLACRRISGPIQTLCPTEHTYMYAAIIHE